MKQWSRRLFCFPREKSTRKKVRVEFSLEDMDMFGFQKDGTYEHQSVCAGEIGLEDVQSVYLLGQAEV